MVTDLTKELYFKTFKHVKNEDLIVKYKICNAYKRITKDWKRPFCIMNVETCFDCPYHLWAFDMFDLDVLDWLNERLAMKYYSES